MWYSRVLIIDKKPFVSGFRYPGIADITTIKYDQMVMIWGIL
jgi:hypothetical protein